jgi:aryl-alcohol dehydrogenase-like predicted oxidoreductase
MNPFCISTGVGLFIWSSFATGALTHPWEDCSDSCKQSDVFLKALFRGREESSDKEVVLRVQKVAEKKGWPWHKLSWHGWDNYLRGAGLLSASHVEASISA